MRPTLPLALLLGALGAVGAVGACAEDPRPPFVGAAGRSPATPDPSDAGPLLGDTAPEPDGKCGSQALPAVADPPNLYFVIDHSASMGDRLAGSDLSKYENARVALAEVLRAIGHRVLYGAAVFPGLANVTGCEAGEQLRKVAPGDPPSYAREGKSGPLLLDLLQRLSIAGVVGGTPVSSTLFGLAPELERLAGRSYVVLITDGAPNCNAQLSCEASGCIPNIEGNTLGPQSCSGSFNCCAPTTDRPDANLGCVDAQPSIDSVSNLTELGIGTYVVGMPGSEQYTELLNAMAEAGGTARETSPKYYPVTDIAGLTAALTAIAASVAISCDIPLDSEPKNRDFVNVYFDDQLVSFDVEDGWQWSEAGHVLIRGSACEQLTSGGVLEVEILEGCKTQVK